MKWTHVSKTGKTLRTWDTANDSLFPEVIFDALEGNPFALIIILGIVGLASLFLLFVIYRALGGSI